MSGERFRVAHLAELDRVPLEDGIWRPVRRALGVSAFGINAYSSAEPGDPLIEEHDETTAGAGGHEELYLLQAGAATFVIDGERVELTAGSMVLIEPGVMRSAIGTEPETTVIVVGGRPGAALPPSPFEYWYSAIPASEAGDHERAYEIVAEGLEHYSEYGTIHYVLGCEAALGGRRDLAIEHLRTAFANDPRTRGWAEADSDLDSLRQDPDFPR